jgi:DNA repair protein RadC
VLRSGTASGNSAKEKAAELQFNPENVVYCDASERQERLGAAAVTLDHNQRILQSRQLYIGTKEHWSVHAAELIGIYQSLELIVDQKRDSHAPPW